MAEFLSDLDLRALPRGLWIVLAPFRVRLDALGGRVVSVPAGFITDLASVPRLPFVYWTVGNRARKAATIHDYLTQVHVVSRRAGDLAFHEIAVIEEGEPVSTAMWAGIRAFGWWAYRTGPRRFARFDNQKKERRHGLR